MRGSPWHHLSFVGVSVTMKTTCEKEVYFGSWFQPVVSCFGGRGCEEAERHSEEHIHDSIGLLTSWPEESRKGKRGGKREQESRGGRKGKRDRKRKSGQQSVD